MVDIMYSLVQDITSRNKYFNHNYYSMKVKFKFFGLNLTISNLIFALMTQSHTKAPSRHYQLTDKIVTAF